MEICRCHIKGVYHSSYSAYGMQFVSIIVQSLRGTVAPVRSYLNIITPHSAAYCPSVLTYLYGVGVNAEYILGAIYGKSHILSNLFGKPCSQLPADIELPAADQVWQIILAPIVQTIKQESFTIEAECLSCYTESHDLKVRELRNDTTPRYSPESINTIPHIPRMLTMLRISRVIVVNGMIATNLLITRRPRNFFIYKYLEI